MTAEHMVSCHNKAHVLTQTTRHKDTEKRQKHSRSDSSHDRRL